MTVLRRNTRKQIDGKDLSNHPDHRYKRKYARRKEPVSRITLNMADLLRIIHVKQREAQDDTQPTTPEGREDHNTRTTGLVRGTGTRCQRARRLKQVRMSSVNKIVKLLTLFIQTQFYPQWRVQIVVDKHVNSTWESQWMKTSSLCNADYFWKDPGSPSFKFDLEVVCPLSVFQVRGYFLMKLDRPLNFGLFSP